MHIVPLVLHIQCIDLAECSRPSVGPPLTLVYHLQLPPVVATGYSYMAKCLLVVWSFWMAFARLIGWEIDLKITLGQLICHQVLNTVDCPLISPLPTPMALHRFPPLYLHPIGPWTVPSAQMISIIQLKQMLRMVLWTANCLNFLAQLSVNSSDKGRWITWSPIAQPWANWQKSH